MRTNYFLNYYYSISKMILQSTVNIERVCDFLIFFVLYFLKGHISNVIPILT